MSKYTRFEVIESDTINKFNLVLIYDDEFVDSQSEITIKEIRTVFKDGKKHIPSFLIPIDCIPKEIYDFDTIDEAVKQGESIVSLIIKQKVVYRSSKDPCKGYSDINMKELLCDICFSDFGLEYNKQLREKLQPKIIK